MTDDTGIYAIENLRDRRAYVGATKQGFLKRWGTHRTTLNRGLHEVPLLQHDWTVYSAGWFKFVPLEVLLPHVSFAPREQYWMDRLVTEGYTIYNVRPASEWTRASHLLPLEVSTLANVFGAIATLHEVAAWAKITVPMVRAMIKRGELPALRVGRLLRVRREDMDAFMTRQQIHPSPPQESDLC
jgi:excisionase family DNA binding protein